MWQVRLWCKLVENMLIKKNMWSNIDSFMRQMIENCFSSLPLTLFDMNVRVLHAWETKEKWIFLNSAYINSPLTLARNAFLKLKFFAVETFADEQKETNLAYKLG